MDNLYTGTATNLDAFLVAMDHMKTATKRVESFIIIPVDERPEYRTTGKVLVSYPASGAGWLRVIAWLPTSPVYSAQNRSMHTGKALGCDYSQLEAAMAGARIFDRTLGEFATIRDCDILWRYQVEKMGYIVLRAV